MMPFLTRRSMSGPLSWARAAVAHTSAARPANTLDLRLNMIGWVDAWINNEARRAAGIAAENRGHVLRFRDSRVTTRQKGAQSRHSADRSRRGADLLRPLCAKRKVLSAVPTEESRQAGIGRSKTAPLPFI